MLSDIEARKAKPQEKPYKLTDGKGLYLLVNPSGVKLWRMNFRYGGKQKTLAHGIYPDVPLGKARKKLDEARRLLVDGVDPMANRKATQLATTERTANSFEAIARVWLPLNAGKWAEITHRQIKKRFEQSLFPCIGSRPIAEIESGFSCESYIPYAWQDKGKTLEIPCPMEKRINVLGVLWVADAKLEVEMVTGKMTSQNVFGKLDGIAGESSTAGITYVVVLDNVSIHTDKIIKGMRPELEAKGLLLYFLPTYSPELNLIEILRRKVKYEWLPFDAHETYDLNEIFYEFGNKYNIIYA